MLRAEIAGAIRAAALAVGEQIRGRIAVYPAQRAPTNPNHWYERGYGSKWRRKDGSVKGRATSEQLGQKWTVAARGDGAVVGNPASYAPFVQSEDEQAAAHAATGWVTDEQAVEAVMESGVVEQIVVDAVVKAMQNIAAGGSG